MSVPLRQQIRVGRYILGQKLRGVRRYPLVLMLEPLFRCNLACPGCGKVRHEKEILSRSLTAGECFSAAEECQAPVVSIAGGEPLLHEDMPAIVSGLIERGRFVYLCTNGLLLEERLPDYRPSPFLTFSVHLDGNRVRHDEAVGREGVFDRAAAALVLARERGFRVTVNTTLYRAVRPVEAAQFFDFAMGLGVEGITVSPGFPYERAPNQDAFLDRIASKQLFREVLRLGRGRGWKFNHSSLFLDFLAGNRTYQCTPWGNPTRNIFGWQSPCYLLAESYTASFSELLEGTRWERYGPGRNPKCADCMLHCGFEPTAVDAAFSQPWQALRVFLAGPRTDGRLAPEPCERFRSTL
jgi:hopanoid biosynthesis associated radical SAM protein HpnH